MVEQVSSLKTGIKSKNTPIGIIPVDWEVVRLGDLAAPIKNAFSDGPFGSNLKLEDYVNSGIPVLQGKNITKNRLEWFDIRYVTKKKAEEHSRSLAIVGDILMTKIGTVGCVAIVNDLRGYDYALIPANLMKITLNRNKIDTYFLYQFLLWSTTRKRIIDISSQTAQPALSLSAMKAFEILCPPLAEQKRIAEILTTVDEVIDKTAQIIKKTKEVKKGLMHRLLTRGIGHKKFKKTKIGEIPVEWEVTQLKDVCDEIYRYPTYYNIEYVEQSSGVPEIRGELIKDNGELSCNFSEYRYISRETSAKFPRTILHEGDFVLSVRGTMGKIGFIPNYLENANMTANLMRLSPNQKKVHPLWMKQFFISDFFQNRLEAASSATTIKTIKAPELKKIELILPPFWRTERNR